MHGLLLGAERGAPGGVYFVTDGPDVVFREFVTRWLATAGVQAPDREIPPPVARALAAAGEWRLAHVPAAGRAAADAAAASGSPRWSARSTTRAPGRSSATSR